MNYRLLPSHFAIFLTFLLMPFWLKWDFAPAPFTSHYVLGFVVSSTIILSLITWILTGFAGWRNLFSNYWITAFLGTLLALTGWTVISQEWAFGRIHYAGMAETAALQMVLITGFIIVLIATRPSQKILLGILIASMLFHGTIGALQVYFQTDLGLSWLGEFPLDPSQSGVSVLEANGIRWLRPYGLVPHPNILAGIIVLGLLASASFIAEGKYTRLSSIAFLLGLFFLLLSFSRGAWLGFAVGILLALPFVIKKAGIWRRIIPLAGLSILLVLGFFLQYKDFFISRTSLTEENTEQRSISDRLVFMEIAWDAIESHPMRGVGAGNFAWYASNYLFFRTNYDLSGNNVHNIYLLVWSELGSIGFALFLGLIGLGIIAAFRVRNTESLTLIAGFIAWAIIGFVDHYLWTLIFTQAMWLGLIALALQPPQKAL